MVTEHPPPDPSLFDDPTSHARASDPPTSHAAARQLDPRTTARQKIAILFALARHPEGAICEVLANEVGNLPNRVARRLGDLRADGLVEATDEVRRASTGRLQLVHRLSDAGVKRVAELRLERS